MLKKLKKGLNLQKKDNLMNCTTCGNSAVKKNGKTHYGKQNYCCKACGRQFVENGQEWFISEKDKALINSLLLERISLSGICRVCNISESWLLKYIKELYSELPEDLNAEQAMPDIASYLEDRMDEEIYRIMALKKIQIHLRLKLIK